MREKERQRQGEKCIHKKVGLTSINITDNGNEIKLKLKVIYFIFVFVFTSHENKNGKCTGIEG